jgi:DNA excision repair protein ERCC-3
VTAYETIERYQPNTADGRRTIESSLRNRTRLNEDELLTLSERSDVDAEWLLDADVAMLEVESVTEAEEQEYVYDVSTDLENFLGDHLFCHNSATPIREDDKEKEIFTLVGPPIGTDWEALFDAGYVAEPEVEIRLIPWASELHRNEYGSAEGHEKRQLASMNPAKAEEVRAILRDHPGEKALVFVEFIEQGDRLAETLGVPFVSGETPHARRRRLFREFRSGPRDVLVVSRVGDEGIDLPNAELAIAASGLGGSRRQGAQRAGRTMRPVGRARMYVLATRGSREEDFARQRMRHLAGKGVRVRETDSVAWAEPEEAPGDG